PTAAASGTGPVAPDAVAAAGSPPPDTAALVETSAASLPNAVAHALGVVAAVALAGAAGRAAFLWVARRGVPAARPGGLGATVAGSQPWWAALTWWVALAGAGFGLAG